MTGISFPLLLSEILIVSFTSLSNSPDTLACSLSLRCFPGGFSSLNINQWVQVAQQGVESGDMWECEVGGGKLGDKRVI